MNKEKFEKLSGWQPPEHWLKIKTIDAHTAGEPLRIILSGFPEAKGNTILKKREFIKNNYDHLRRALIFEPRGHADMYGALITDPATRDSDFGVLFLHNEGYSSMCGHGIIALTKVVVETGLVKAVEPVTKIKIDTPAGLVTSYAEIANGKVSKVYFHNVPSFVFLSNQKFNIPGIGKIHFDVAYGGAFYAFVDADNLGIKLTSQNFKDIIDKGMEIKHAVMNEFEIKHPFEDDLSFLYGTIFTGKPKDKSSFSRNVCVFAEGEVDRSPTGTGVSARMALHYKKNEIKLNKEYIIESIVDTKFTGKAISKTKFGKYDAVIPEVGGDAFITGKNEFYINPDDPLKEGFILR